ncbi:MAG: T9SS type A sorting domain-containing protein [Candidatus Marinimicrobia bacterium]|nr:T9SS type A sorting domain-containing protein [Candidatus Neomarinimicrobiota bacterium]MBT3946128.1 T9SS type A sorting domain-containing protein [Candidatus Neomarinimicrobiota bacterium]MBT4154475.1 T9SS type A sorting domain-containing protein [Candidatus Neomarinimicrobiota bacterium]MBT4554486.1 T9SS type A sorting domain-containing protein [Candidatus Neomarinimicrobiota bacterium]MBT4752549.1 T9SS type A sorting domain-containing protein [Candidatus Neomarinimicrobiota bacterium]
MKNIFYIFVTFQFLTFSQELDDRFHSVQEINALIDSLDQLEELDGLFHVDTIGFTSQENLPILAVKISDNADIKEDEPRVLFVGQVHAEEILGVEAILSLMNELLFPSASTFSHMNILKQYLEIWLVPTANPEGLNVVHEGLDFSYRKNKRDFSPTGPVPNGIFDYEPSIGNDIDGVDLNRNFDFNWAFGDTFLEPDNSDYASHYDYYKGENPFSEGEAIALRDLALENDFVFSMVWHSSRSGNLSEKVFTSWRWEDSKEAPDLGLMKTISDHFSSLIETEDGSGSYLSVFSGSRNGKLHDWFYRETGCIQYLIECGTANLQPDSALIENTLERTRPAMLYLMDRIIGYYTDAAQVTGIVSDATTNLPLEGAIVEVLEHTGSVLKHRLTDEFGRYRRILTAGTYTLSVKADGYIPQEITAIANNSGITTENILLVPAPIHSVNMVLYHDTDDINTVDGVIKNEFGETPIQITSGDNIFNLTSGVYDISFPMYDNLIPWDKIVILNSDITLQIAFLYGTPLTLSESWPWESSEGPWQAGNVMLRSQENNLYENGDSTLSTQWMESQLVDISGTNRAVVKVIHRFETEWDHDLIKISILDGNENVLGQKRWSGGGWEEYNTNYITAISDSEFSHVKVRLEFTPDQSVNYRGWELQDLTLFSNTDQYLELTESFGGISPKIPMVINGLNPNPSNGRFQIDLANFPGGFATIRVFNLLGQEIKSIDLNNLSAGRQIIDLNLNNLNGRPLSSGMVFVRVETKKQKLVKKCIILKN